MKSGEREHLEDMLKLEGIMRMGGIVKVLEEDGEVIGFFSYRFDHGYPSLWHFYVLREHRSFKNGLKLVREFRKFARDLGYTKAIVSAKKEYLCRFIEWYFKKKPYGKSNGMYFYLVEV